MRKLVGVARAAVMALTLVACGGDPAPAPDAAQVEEQQEQQAEEPAEETIPEAQADPQPESETTTQTSSSDFRATMDAYEAFKNGYCDFMETYNSDSANAVSMLADYTEMMSNYAEMTEQIEAIDTETLSADDFAYYTEVMARVTQRLAEIGQ